MLPAPKGFHKLPRGVGIKCRRIRDLHRQHLPEGWLQFLQLESRDPGSPTVIAGPSGAPYCSNSCSDLPTETLLLWRMRTSWWINQGFPTSLVITPITFLIFPCVCVNRSVGLNSLQPSRLLYWWNSPGRYQTHPLPRSRFLFMWRKKSLFACVPVTCNQMFQPKWCQLVLIVSDWSVNSL